MPDSPPDRSSPTAPSRLVFLGPQRFRPTVNEALRSLGVAGPVALVTAGWQERESEHGELREHLGCEVLDLMLYHRADDVVLRDRELAAALEQRQESLRRLQRFYRLRLNYELDAARELMARPGQEPFLEEHRRGAIRAVRTLDRQHLRRIGELRDEWREQWRPEQRPAVVRHRIQIQQRIEESTAVAIAGGHVAVLLNRMQLFDVAPLFAGKPVIAWSAGAMVLAERVVLFHDNPPQGAGNPEVFDAGLGLGRRLLPLPHASRRLRLNDPTRVSLFARRFTPDTCVALDADSRVDWDGERWTASRQTRRLDYRGGLRELVRA